jgi:hypothetical protein
MNRPKYSGAATQYSTSHREGNSQIACLDQRRAHVLSIQ